MMEPAFIAPQRRCTTAIPSVGAFRRAASIAASARTAG